MEAPAVSGELLWPVLGMMPRGAADEPHTVFGSILHPFPMSFYTDIYVNYCFRELHSHSGPSTSETGT